MVHPDLVSRFLATLAIVVLLKLVQKLQDLDEEIDDVQVEVEDSDDVVLWADVLHDQLGVIDDEAREEDSSHDRQAGLHQWAADEDLQRETNDVRECFVV